MATKQATSAAELDRRFGEMLDEAFARAADPARAVSEKAYLKSPIEHIGVPVPAIRAAVAEAQRALRPDPDTAVVIARSLWARPTHEHRAAACVLLQRMARRLGDEDLAAIEQMVDTSFTWAYVDTLAVHVAGPIVANHPELAAELDRWATARNFWVRRAAMLTLLEPLRRGGGDWSRFVRYAVAMLGEREFFIRKAIGWILRERCRTRPEEVVAFCEEHAATMSGVTWREATRALPQPEQAALAALRPARARRDG